MESYLSGRIVASDASLYQNKVIEGTSSTQKILYLYV